MLWMQHIQGYFYSFWALKNFGKITFFFLIFIFLFFINFLGGGIFAAFVHAYAVYLLSACIHLCMHDSLIFKCCG